MKKIALVVAAAFLTLSSAKVNASAKDNMHFGAVLGYRPTMMMGFDKVGGKDVGAMKTLNIMSLAGGAFFSYDFHPYVGAQAEAMALINSGGIHTPKENKKKVKDKRVQMTYFGTALNLLANINVLGDSSLKFQIGLGLPIFLAKTKKVDNKKVEKYKTKPFDLKVVGGVEYIYPAWGFGGGLRTDFGILGMGKKKDKNDKTTPKYRELGVNIYVAYDFSKFIRS